LIADNDHFAPAASALPGSEEEAQALLSGTRTTEVFPLTLFAVAGMMLFPIATDFITLFVALEVLSLPLYIMTGLSRRRRLMSQEAALKYFLLGAYSSAFFLFGIAFLYGYSGTLSLTDVGTAYIFSVGSPVFLYIGMVFLTIGLLFKVGAVPFHSWTPDVYQGAPTPITGFMAACTKIAAFGALLRIFYGAFFLMQFQWKPFLTTISIITMVLGAIAAMSQRDIKRTLAYSSITHAGFLLAGVVALNKDGLAASMFYLVAYGFATVGAFGIVTLVRDSSGEVTDLSKWAGLAKKSPLVSVAMGIFLLSFGGVPLTSGFISKFSIFTAAYQSGNIAIVVVGVLSSAIALFFYLRVVLMLFFQEAPTDGVSVVIPSIMTRIAIGVCAVMTLILGVYPSLLLNLVNTMATLVH
jgi:NADH-quinone oxidoreductase subunit N